MALTPRDSDVFLREVDEELRRDQMRGFVARWGKLIVGAVVLFLAAVGGYLWWENRQRSIADQHAEDFTAVLTDVSAGKVKGTDPRLEKLLQDGGPAYQTQALLLKAGLAVEAGKDADAIAIYKRVASDGDLPQAYRDAALVRQTVLEYDKMQPQAVIDRLKPLAVKGNPWFGTAGEMVGISYLRQGKSQLAAPIFDAMVKDEKVPRSIRQRVNEIALSLGVGVGPEESGAGAAPAKETNQ